MNLLFEVLSYRAKDEGGGGLKQATDCRQREQSEYPWRGAIASRALDYFSAFFKQHISTMSKSGEKTWPNGKRIHVPKAELLFSKYCNITFRPNHRKTENEGFSLLLGAAYRQSEWPLITLRSAAKSIPVTSYHSTNSAKRFSNKAF
jgi:hypothetical protein